MKTLFLICTAVTILQVLDVSITGVSSQENRSSGTPDPNAGKLKTSRTLKKNVSTQKITKPANNPTSPDSVDNDPGTNPNNDDSDEADPPKTFKESGKRVVKTLKKMATNRGVGLLNGFTGLLKKTGGAFSFFGNFLGDRAKGVKDVAKESLGTVSSFSDSTTRGAKHLLNGGKVIGTQAGKELFSSFQKATRLGTNITKLGGTAVGIPLSIGEDVVGTTNQIAKVPSRVSKLITKPIKKVLSYVEPESDQETSQEEEEEEKEEKEETEEREEKEKIPIKKPVITPKQTPKKPIVSP